MKETIYGIIAAIVGFFSFMFIKRGNDIETLKHNEEELKKENAIEKGNVEAKADEVKEVEKEVKFNKELNKQEKEVEVSAKEKLKQIEKVIEEHKTNKPTKEKCETCKSGKCNKETEKDNSDSEWTTVTL